MLTVSPEALGISSSRLNRVYELTSSYIGKGKLAGTLTFVSRRGQVAHLQCQGKMNLETGEDIKEDTIFRIYSMTKPITTVMAMILYERGYFQLYTPITRFLPEFKDMEVFVSGTADDYKTVKATRDINVADLMTHTAGLTYYFDMASPVGELYRRKAFSDFGSDDFFMADFIKKLSEMPLLFTPGTKWNYSYATDVLGYLLEVITGKNLDTLFKEEIFEPLGMVDTDFYVPQDKLSRFASLYLHNSANLASGTVQTLSEFKSPDSSYHSLPSKKAGGGGLVSTVSDYYKFASMLLNKGLYGDKHLVSPKTVDLMMSNFLPGDILSSAVSDMSAMIPAGYGFGLGGAVMQDPARARMLGTAGEYSWSGAAHTSFFVDPKEKLIGILMTQLFPFGSYDIGNQFKQAVYQSIID